MNKKKENTSSIKVQPEDRYARIFSIIMMNIFGLVSAILIIFNVLRGRYDFMTRGLFFPLFLLIPYLFKYIKIERCYRFECFLYVFLIYAYDYGCVYGAFQGDGTEISDKISHFFSGFLFTILGILAYYYLEAKNTQGNVTLKKKGTLAATYGLFFSMFIAVMWEVIEFTDFNLTGNDSQNTLTTGVFDTMQDLIACLIASVVSAAFFIIYTKTNFKLLTASIVQEFYDKNIAQKYSKYKNTK